MRRYTILTRVSFAQPQPAPTRIIQQSGAGAEAFYIHPVSSNSSTIVVVVVLVLLPPYIFSFWFMGIERIQFLSLLPVKPDA